MKVESQASHASILRWIPLDRKESPKALAPLAADRAKQAKLLAPHGRSAQLA